MTTRFDGSDDRNFEIGEKVIGLSASIFWHGKEHKNIGLTYGTIVDKTSYNPGGAFAFGSREYYLEIENDIYLKEEKCIRYTKERWDELNKLYLIMQKSIKEFNDSLHILIKDEDEKYWDSASQRWWWKT